MTNFPAPQTKIPEDHYQFRLNKEPILDEKIGKGGKKFSTVTIYAIGLNDDGEFYIIDNFLPWEDRYVDLLAALGVDHSAEVEVVGSVFEADVVHVPDQRDSTKTWPKLKNITSSGREPGDDIGEDDLPAGLRGD